MADVTTLRRSPLAHLTRDLAGASSDLVSLRERPFHTMVSVRADPGAPAADRLSRVLGEQLPQQCGQATSSRAVTAYEHVGVTTMWCGPDEWLVVSAEPASEQDELTPALQDALAADAGAVVDVSANRTILELAGEASRGVLEKGCPVDLHPSAFGPGRAVLTTVGAVPVLLWHARDGVYRVLPRASFADYLARWILDAMAEYRSPLVP